MGAKQYVVSLIPSSPVPSHLSHKPLLRFPAPQMIMKTVSHLLPMVMLPASNFGKNIYSVSISLSHIGAKSKYPRIYLRLEAIHLQRAGHATLALARPACSRAPGSLHGFESPTAKWHFANGKCLAPLASNPYRGVGFDTKGRQGRGCLTAEATDRIWFLVSWLIRPKGGKVTD